MLDLQRVKSLGIIGKRSLWRELQVVSNEDTRLREYEFDTLLHRADDQFQAVEQERLRLAPQVFVSKSETGGDVPITDTADVR